MAGRTDFTTDARWEDVRTIWYTLVDDAYQTLAQHYGAWRRTGPQPLFSDSEASTVGLISDTWFAGHEALRLSFLRQYHPTLFPHLPPDGWFNQRRTVLAVLIDQVRRVITWHSGLMAASDPVRLLDSAPITLAKDTRGGDNRTLNGSEYFGVASSKGAKLFGLRLHVTTTLGQVVDEHSVRVVFDSVDDATNLEVAVGIVRIGDRQRDVWVALHVAHLLPRPGLADLDVFAVPLVPDRIVLHLAVRADRREVRDRRRLQQIPIGVG